MLITSLISSGLIENSLALGFKNIKLTEDLIKANKILEVISTHDALTGLPNRRLFYQKLTQAIYDAKKNNKKIALMFLDLNKFKEVNDTLGHDIGDQLLIQIAERIKKILPSEDTASRIGGDEFVLFMEDFSSQDEVEKLAEKIAANIKIPLQLDQHTTSISTSIGISLFPKDGYDKDSLIKKADMAMYQAKQSGKTFIFA